MALSGWPKHKRGQKADNEKHYASVNYNAHHTLLLRKFTHLQSRLTWYWL